MLCILLGLGNWQVQRLAWKRGILADIERAEALPPVPFDLSPMPFRRVVASGRYLPGEARYGIEVRSVGREGPVMGSHVLSALAPASGLPVIVDRGWAPLDFNAVPPDGEVHIEAYVRPADQPVWFGPKDDLQARRFYTLSPPAIGTSLGVTVVASSSLVMLGPARGTLPQPASTLPRPPNDHLSYAVTWFGLSAVLMLIFGLYVRQEIRNDHRS